MLINFYLRGKKMTDNMPVYVKIDDYKEVLEVMSGLQENIANARNLLAQMEDIKSEEENELDTWKLGLDDIDEKLTSLTTELSHSNN